MGSTFATLRALDNSLVEKGHLPLTEWWSTQHRRLYEHATARALVARVGRGGIKSQSSAKVALNEVLFGDWDVPPGETHFFAFVSATKEEAAQRLNLLARFLQDLGYGFDRDGDQVVLRDKPLGFRVFAAQVGAVSGFRCIGYVCDEVSKWKAADRFTNPASEVVASLNGMIVTHAARAKRLLVSSPMSLTDYHFKRFDIGNTDEQLVCQAATWEANPSITEDETKRLEADPRVWRREYAAIPQAAALAAFAPEAVNGAFLAPTVIEPASPMGRVGIVDASSGKKDTWAWGIVGWRRCDGRTRLVFDHIDGFEGSFWSQKSGDEVVALVAEHFRASGVGKVVGDQREALMLGSAFRRNDIDFKEIPWTSSNKERAVGTIRRWLADALLVLPGHEKLRLELLSFEERVSQSGAFTFGARGTGHDDYVALLLTAAMADGERMLPGSPNAGVSIIEAMEALRANGGRIFHSRKSELW